MSSRKSTQCAAGADAGWGGWRRESSEQARGQGGWIEGSTPGNAKGTPEIGTRCDGQDLSLSIKEGVGERGKRKSARCPRSHLAGSDSTCLIRWTAVRKAGRSPLGPHGMFLLPKRPLAKWDRREPRAGRRLRRPPAQVETEVPRKQGPEGELWAGSEPRTPLLAPRAKEETPRSSWRRSSRRQGVTGNLAGASDTVRCQVARPVPPGEAELRGGGGEAAGLRVCLLLKSVAGNGKRAGDGGQREAPGQGRVLISKLEI